MTNTHSKKELLDPQRRVLLSKMAAHSLWAQVEDPRAHTAPARLAFTRDKFEREVDPDGTLAPEDRARRADHARRAYMIRLAVRSAESRRAARSVSVPAPRGTA